MSVNKENDILVSTTSFTYTGFSKACITSNLLMKWIKIKKGDENENTIMV